ncbi:MAG TPA: hypothetical protein VHN15_04450 [Thermoanaerobaculia bacterium]|nr:hypothetical protein [Thermoanaerobaculia bacterium]
MRQEETNPEINLLLGRRTRTREGEAPSMLRALAWLQGIFYVLTGVWPLVSIGTFVMVTGPKVDLWLVKTAGVLITVIGATLLLAARRRRIGPEMVFLAAGSAAGLAGIDLVYALSDRIWDIYLLDAVVEIALVLLWLVACRRAGDRP